MTKETVAQAAYRFLNSIGNPVELSRLVFFVFVCNTTYFEVNALPEPNQAMRVYPYLHSEFDFSDSSPTQWQMPRIYKFFLKLS